MTSVAEAKTLLLQFLPPGAARWMRVDSTTDSTVGRMWSAIANSAKALGYDYLEILRRELHARQMTYRLSDLEAILRIPTDTARSNDSRRAAIISRRREFGASTLPGILGALYPIAGTATAVTIMEHGRAALDALVAGTFGTITATAGNTASATVTMHDNAAASEAGLRFRYSFSGGDAGLVMVQITSPDGITKQWQDEVAVDGTKYVLFGAEFAGCQIIGDWSITVDNSNGGVTSAVLDADNMLIIEGLGRAVNGTDGLGARIFEWSAVVNESLTSSTTYDREKFGAIVGRWNPAQDLGGVAIYQTDGGLTCLSDNTNAIADLCVAGG